MTITLAALISTLSLSAMWGFSVGRWHGLRETDRRLKRQREVMERLEGNNSQFIPPPGKHDDMLNASAFSRSMFQNALGASGAIQAQLGNATPLFGGSAMQNPITYPGARTEKGVEAMRSQALENMRAAIDEAIIRGDL